MAEKTVKCVVLRDFWPEENRRVHAGTIVEVDMEAAMKGMEDGLLARVKAEK